MLNACSNRDKEQAMKRTRPIGFSYLALGDSYTIGEAVAETERWPKQLVDSLAHENIIADSFQIVATTGWTTDELQVGMQEAVLMDDYDLVSLLIGVNNQYRGYPISQYEQEFSVLLDSAIHLAGGRSDRVFVVSIPDYGVTPFASKNNLDVEKIARELDEYNRLAASISGRNQVAFFEITAFSRKVATDTTFIAGDGLHPSGKLYKQWVQTVYEWVHDALR